MRLAWATPLDLRSAIGRVSRDVVGGLVSRGHEVLVVGLDWTLPDGLQHEMAAPIRWWADGAADQLASYDALVVNVGDHFLYHGGMFELMGRIPTVGVFHDFYLYDLFNGWALGDGRPAPQQAALREQTVREIYGEEGVADLLAARRGELDLAAIAARLPMTEWVARGCDGALAHSGFYRQRLLAGCPGPVATGAMPVSGRDVAPLAPRSGDKTLIMTVGVMNPNKCVDRVIAGLGASQALRSATRYRLVGPIDVTYAQTLAAAASGAGVELEMLGEVTDEVLAAELAEADILCALRDPVLEGASGSAIEALMAGRPLIVADAGFYSDLPDELVFKVPAQTPQAELVARLEMLVADEPLRRRVGAQARAWAEGHFALPAYLDTLESLVEQAIAARPGLTVARRIGRGLAELGLSSRDPAADRIGATLARLFPVD